MQIYPNWAEDANHYTTDEVSKKFMQFLLFVVK